jgi:hypothetical protein
MSAKKSVTALQPCTWRSPSKRAILERTMNRFLLGGCLVVMFGCGARTDYFTDQDEANGPPQGVAGGLGAAGAPQAGGAPSATAGAPNVAAGSPGVGAAPGSGGAPTVGGGPGIAGAPSVGGGPAVAGAPSVGGAPGIGGGTSTGGVPNAGGAAGSGATSGIVEACEVIAGNSCQQCLCSACSSQIVQCFSNLGCAVILACAQQTNCQGASCYSPKNCRAVIDQFGGLSGKAMRDVLSLFTCSVGSQNSCSCN